MQLTTLASAWLRFVAFKACLKLGSFFQAFSTTCKCCFRAVQSVLLLSPKEDATSKFCLVALQCNMKLWPDETWSEVAVGPRSVALKLL